MEDNKYGRTDFDRIKFLINDLKQNDSLPPRLNSFANIYASTIGGCFDFGSEHDDFFHATNKYALRQLAKAFYKRYGKHLVDYPSMLGIDSWDEL